LGLLFHLLILQPLLDRGEDFFKKIQTMLVMLGYGSAQSGSVQSPSLSSPKKLTQASLGPSPGTAHEIQDFVLHDIERGTWELSEACGGGGGESSRRKRERKHIDGGGGVDSSHRKRDRTHSDGVVGAGDSRSSIRKKKSATGGGEEGGDVGDASSAPSGEESGSVSSTMSGECMP